VKTHRTHRGLSDTPAGKTCDYSSPDKERAAGARDYSRERGQWADAVHAHERDDAERCGDHKYYGPFVGRNILQLQVRQRRIAIDTRGWVAVVVFTRHDA